MTQDPRREPVAVRVYFAMAAGGLNSRLASSPVCFGILDASEEFTLTSCCKCDMYLPGVPSLHFQACFVVICSREMVSRFCGF